jgi:metal-dependent hydrolase (beta-lactamase superfamily II)
MGVEFHFLNVGYGDCTIVHWPERTRGDKTLDERIMMVDIYHHEDHEEYEDAIKYYKANFKNPDGSIKPIFRFVCSHPHQDHICGLKKLFDDNGINILNFWDLEHSFVPDDFGGHPTHEEDWEAYELLGSKESPATVLRYTRETTPQPLWNEHGDRITILSPSKSLVKCAHYKDDGTKRDTVEIDEMSFALSIRVNGRSVILAGDGRATTWNDIYENCKDTLKECYVLKAGHHGQESSFHEDAVKLMEPILIVLSNSKEENDSNGSEAKYKKACPKALICKTWEGTVFVKVPFVADKPILVNRDV